MAASCSHLSILILIYITLVTQLSTAELVQEQPLVLKYHNGALLKGNITVNLIWYGKFTAAQRSIVVDFIHSLTSSHNTPPPSAASWWHTTSKYKKFPTSSTPSYASNLIVGKQLLLSSTSLGNSLKTTHLLALASKSSTPNSITIILTSADVTFPGFCTNRCGTHGSIPSKKTTYIWVGNPEQQCPGYCAWPFHQPIYGPQTPPLVSPNGDFGVDGMIINLATVLAGTVTNPFRNGYFQGPAAAPLEAVTACTGAFGKGAYPGYPGEVLVDKATGASYNAHGVNGRKYLLPAMWDPQTSACQTLV